MNVEKIELDKKLRKDIADGKITVSMSPAVIRKAGDKKTADDVKNDLAEGRMPDGTVLISRGGHLILVPERRFENLIRNEKIDETGFKKDKGPTIWDVGDELKALFPEITADYDAAVEMTGKAGCTSCVKRSYANKLNAKLAELSKEFPDRVIPDDLMKALGPSFGRALARAKYGEAPYGAVAVKTKNHAMKILEPVMHSHSTEGVRPSCLDCCRKHLGQAIILFQESEIPEYANHFWLGIGHLAELESEALSTYPAFAKQIRDIRLAMMADRDYVPSIMDLFDDIDTLDIINGKDT